MNLSKVLTYITNRLNETSTLKAIAYLASLAGIKYGYEPEMVATALLCVLAGISALLPDQWVDPTTKNLLEISARNHIQNDINKKMGVK